MYESPILIAAVEMHRDIIKKQDDYIFLTIEKALKCEVNREELLKALAYDRDQYDKGFRDGRAYKPPIETNYDRLVSKSPEELADWLAEVLFHCSNTICDERCPMYKCCCDQPSDNIEDWLKEEVDHD